MKRRASNRYARERSQARVRAQSHRARVRRRHATRGQRRAAGLALFAAAFAGGVAVGGANAPFWLSIGDAPGRGIEHISVLGHERIDASEIAAQSGVEPGTTAHEIDTEVVAQRVLSHPWLRTARVRLAGDDELLVIVKERRAAAVLHAADTDSFRVVEADGTPFAAVSASSFPELVRLQQSGLLEAGQPQPLVVDALELLGRIEHHGIPRPESLALPGDGERAALGWRFQLVEGGPEVVLGLGALDERLARLAELILARPAAVRSAERIDLRFRDRAILRTADTIPAEGTAESPSPETTTGVLTARLGGRPASG